MQELDSSEQAVATVDAQRHAVDVPSRVRGEEDHRPRDVLRLRDAPERIDQHVLGDHPLRVLAVSAAGERRVDAARAHHVDPDAARRGSAASDRPSPMTAIFVAA